jgi:2-oxoglutarate ferredoxin oxidoreductase subunit delta
MDATNVPVHPEHREAARFRPRIEENSKIRATRYLGLCKSCGSCIMKCPVNAISWHEKDIGQLGQPGIRIDLDKCIGCETCERICPDHAIEITNKRLESMAFSKGPLGFVVRLNARVIEMAVTTFRASGARLKNVGEVPGMTLVARVLRGVLRYGKEPSVQITIVDDRAGE